MENKVDILSNPKAKTLWKITVKATNLDEALSIINKECPELKITKESIIYHTVHKEGEQLKLFK